MTNANENEFWWGEVSETRNGAFRLGDKTRRRYFIESGIVRLPEKEPTILFGRLGGGFGPKITEIGYIRTDRIQVADPLSEKVRSKNGLQWNLKVNTGIQAQVDRASFTTIPLSHTEHRKTLASAVLAFLQEKFAGLTPNEVINLPPDVYSAAAASKVSSELGAIFPYKLIDLRIFEIEPADESAKAAVAEAATLPIIQEKRERDRQLEDDERQRSQALKKQDRELEKSIEKDDAAHRAAMASLEEQHRQGLLQQREEFDREWEARELEHLNRLAVERAMSAAQVMRIQAQTRLDLDKLEADQRSQIEAESHVREIERLRSISTLADESSRVVGLIGSDGYLKLEEMAKEVEIAKAKGTHQNFIRMMGATLAAAEARGQGKALLKMLGKMGVIDKSQVEVDLNMGSDIPVGEENDSE